ncbi:hypothetical protein [Eoetvoesiella caeni]
MQDTQTKKMDVPAVIWGALFGAAISMAGTYFLIQKQSLAMAEHMRQTPAIVIVDFAKIVASYPDGATPEETAELMVKTNNSIVKLRDAGFLVLDSQAVLSGPKELYLPENVILGE